MKHFILMLMVFSTVSMSFAQSTTGTGGVRRGGTSLEMTQKMKDRLKTTLNVNDAQVDSISAIQHAYEYKKRALNGDTNAGEADKKQKLAELETERRQKLRAILSEKQINKLDSYSKNMRNRRAERNGQATVS